MIPAVLLARLETELELAHLALIREAPEVLKADSYVLNGIKIAEQLRELI